MRLFSQFTLFSLLAAICRAFRWLADERPTSLKITSFSAAKTSTGAYLKMPREMSTVEIVRSAAVRLTALATLVAYAALALLDGASAASAWKTPATAAIFGGLAFSIVIFAAPIVFRRMMAVKPLPEGELRRRLDFSAEQAGVELAEILVWNTRHRLANAVAFGYSRRTRCVALTDLLLKRFSDDEIESLFRHELAHFKRGHLPLRIAAVVLPVAGAWALAACCPSLFASLEGWLDLANLSEQSRRTVLYPMAILVYGHLTLGRTARLCEYDADAWACRFATPDAAAFKTQIELMARTIFKLNLENGADPQRSSWLHPSAFQRARRLGAMHYKTAASLAAAGCGQGADRPESI
jgi:Zn-dependent protease with chaperone function